MAGISIDEQNDMRKTVFFNVWLNKRNDEAKRMTTRATVGRLGEQIFRFDTNVGANNFEAGD